MAYYKVLYTNPNNVTNQIYVLETRRKADVDELKERVAKYPGSYNIIEEKRMSEAGGKKYEALRNVAIRRTMSEREKEKIGI